ncbi:hypothetical protein [Lysinibacillus antri]|uniref:Uncharacterized protein n=1 Tax=Lysinibacillus antri TaxID=2498145 RepID=A0A432LES7_9BACI|nr:hypothetical protein [Lysinibacillus antri]RUL54652.1 hypothetical protein EK386_05665 [Lysinibacillus antri]
MINKVFNYQSKVTIKLWLLFLLLSQSLYMIMKAYSIPSISYEVGGLLIFDMKPLGYTYDYAYTFLSKLSEKGYEIYKYTQLPLDLLFPIFNCLTGLCTFVLLFRFYHKVKFQLEVNWQSTFAKTLLSIPFIAMVADYLENISIFIMLLYKTAVPKPLVYTADVFTIIKSMSTLAFYIVIIILCIISSLKWMRNKTKGEPIDGKLRNTREENGTFEGSYTGRNASSVKSEKSQ